MMVGKLHHRTPNLIGQTFGFLTVLSAAHVVKGKRLWTCRCVCGALKNVAGTELRRGATKSCGCQTKGMLSKARTTHGMSKHPAFAVWRSMIDRCKLPTHHAWRNYGGRGITVCKRWQQFETFWADMGGAYQPGLTLDRADNNSGYCKQNCRWVPARVQVMNRRNTVRAVDIPELSERTGILRSTLYYRIAHGWSIEQLTRAPNPRNRYSTS